MSTLSSELGGNIHDEGILHTINLQFSFAFSFLVPLHTWYVCCADGLPCLLCHHTGLIEHHVTPIVEQQQALILWFLFSGIFYMFKTLPRPRFLVLVHYCSIWLHVRTATLASHSDDCSCCFEALACFLACFSAISASACTCDASRSSRNLATCSSAPARCSIGSQVSLSTPNPFHQMTYLGTPFSRHSAITSSISYMS